ncbi:hypothetical protein Sjap_000220 [Stephania japonica]|uniref:Pentatricopeptide repeat-containing protein n=1 Tax=Stephania japonica TaxID=461633 RepID=A0AAP0PS93_9MAGN
MATKLNSNAPIFDLLKRLYHKDWLSPNEVLKIFKSLRDPNHVLNAFDKISQRKDYQPNEALYTLIIQKLSHAKKLNSIGHILSRIKAEPRGFRVSDDFFYNVIKIYGNVGGHIDKAIETLFSMPEYHCWPTVKTFSCVLNMLVCAKQFDVIHEVYLGAPKLGVQIDTCCLNILIKGLCECGKFDVAFELIDELPKQGLKPSVRTYSTIMHFLCERGRVEEAFEVYGRMEAEGVNPDTIVFNTLISGLCRRGRVAEGMELFERMGLKGCSPNSGTYLAVMYGLLGSKKFVEAKSLMEQMISKRMSPSFMSYKLLIHGLCDENLLEDVDSVLKMMVRQGFVPKMGTWRKIVESMASQRMIELRDDDKLL